MNNQEKLQELFELKEHIRLGGGEDKIKKQHEKGKLTARERLDYLFDEGTFQEYNMFAKHRCTYFGMDKVDLPADGVVTGYGEINGRKAFAYAHDFTVIGGANGEVQNLKVNHVLTLARQALVPCIGLFDSGGGRIQEGGDTSAGYVFHGNVMNSGVVPQINALMGPCAGAAVYSPALTDFILAVDKTCHAHITGPKAIERVTGEIIDSETLGGAMTHSTKSGVVHLFCIDDYDCIDKIKKLLSFFPQSYKDKPEIIASADDPNRRCEELNDIIPEEPNKPYNMKDVIRSIADNNEFFEIQEFYATNLIIGFIRLNGMSIGVVANQPSAMAGCLDINASDKGARFIRTCDCFNIPLLSLVDTPGYLPGVTQEYGGIIRHGAKMLYAWSEATVPIMVCATRKVYGGANSGMMSAEMYPDFIFAWMTAERAIMGAEGAVNVIYNKEIADKEKKEGKEAAEALRAEYIAQYQKEFMNPYRAAERMRFNDVIEPAETRSILIRAFEMYWNKDKAIPARKHGNMPV